MSRRHLNCSLSRCFLTRRSSIATVKTLRGPWQEPRQEPQSHRLGSISGGIIPHPSDRRWRIRIRGPLAEAILAEAIPSMSTRTRARAESARAPITPSA